MLQSLAQFRIALLDLLEQPHIFDGDNCLVSKGLEEIDLLVGERFDYRTTNENRSNRNTFAYQWHGKLGSIT